MIKHAFMVEVDEVDKKRYKEELEKNNERTIIYFVLFGLPFTALGMVVHYIMGFYKVFEVNVVLFLYFVFLSGLVLLAKRIHVIRFYNKELEYKSHSTIMMYLVQAPVLFAATIMGTTMDTKHQAIIIFVFISVFPILILDNRMRICLWTVGWLIFFCILSYNVKTYGIFKVDLLGSIEFGIASLIVSMGVLTTRMKGISDYLRALPPEIDSMTKLYNVYYFLSNAPLEKKAMKSQKKTPCIIFIDVCDMKKYNEVHGYSAGSKLLLKIANILKKTYVDKLAARFSEDHFVVLTSVEEREEELEKMHKEIAKLGNMKENIDVKTGTYVLKKSFEEIGIACDRAKVAVDFARKNYGARDFVYDDLEKEYIEKQYVLEHVDEAIENKWIVPYYQPIVRAASGKVCDEEALARWIDPEKGVLNPGVFIPVLEEKELIYKVDLHIVKSVLEDLRERRENGYSIMPVSVNLSRTDFKKCNMVEAISGMCKKYEISPEYITIEITESAIAGDKNMLHKVIHDFHEKGFKVWMDDFGSEYSSLNALKEFDFDLLKFDMSFVSKMKYGDKAEIILTELIDMAKKIGTDTLAEGVETEEQYRILREIGCNRLQGFYFDKPNKMQDVVGAINNKKNMPFEFPEEMEFMQKIGEINLNAPFEISNENLELSHILPAGVIKLDENSGGYVIRANREFIRLLNQIDIIKSGYFMDLKYQDEGKGDNDFESGEKVVWNHIKLSKKFVSASQKALNTKKWEFVISNIGKGVTIMAYLHVISDPKEGAIMVVVMESDIVEELKDYVEVKEQEEMED
ncbi:diguanylate cyclase (GGDEF) domain-containing protein [Lachnospiraceae bacterium C7]|nr:diguanylate cyclase (GGDEF) domain-containing protein [Lachnospiraceae bacterium C7]